MGTPCQRDPDAWFIDRDGKQDPDDELIFNKGSLVADAHANGDDRADELIIAEAEAEALRDALRRRRHAKDACHVECPVRLQCLELALDGPTSPEKYGTWGGYYAEELRAIRRARDRRVD